MRDRESHDDAIRRALARDDLLRLAAAADRAVAIVRQRALEEPPDAAAGSLFNLALSLQLALATNGDGWAIRAQAWDHAAVIVRFCELVNRPTAACVLPANEMHSRALAELVDGEPPPGLRRLDKDLMLGVLIRHHAARDLRLTGHFQEARELARRSPADLFGTGAEAQIAHYLYELGATFIAQSAADDIRRQYGELETYWEQTRARGFSTHYRFELIRALTTWSARPGDQRARAYLQESIRYVKGAIPDDVDEAAGRDGEDSIAVREISVLLTTAEYLVATGAENDMGWALDLALDALGAADRIRSRWRVIARSRAPLTEAFRRVYGDIAVLAHRIDGQRAAELGLRAALSAKSTGFAARIRDGRTFDDNPRVSGLLEEINQIENPAPGAMSDTPAKRRLQLAGFERELAEAVSPMLADTVFPGPPDLGGLVEAIGPWYALDYVELIDTLQHTAIFRALVEPGGRMSFDRIDPGSGFQMFVDQLDAQGDLVTGLDSGVRALRGRSAHDAAHTRELDFDFTSEPGLLPDGRPDFRALAQRVLPDRLVNDILPASAEDLPIRLIVSAHSWLSLLPWPALRVDVEGTRLVERAVIAQCPVLTCLSGDLPPRVSGSALVRLVGRDEDVWVFEEHLSSGVDVADERAAWDLKRTTDGVPLTAFDLHGDDRHAPIDRPFGEALAKGNRWQFLHIAAHGSGKGFDQRLHIPGEPLSAARALGLRWPASVLMASCHVGLVLNDHGTEPLSLVTALLTGGARCVVAGIDSVDDAGTGRVAASMVRAIRREHLSLDVALRNAQMAEIAHAAPESEWALLSAYIR